MSRLLILVADKNMEFTLRGILARDKSLGISRIDATIQVLNTGDGGVRTQGTGTLGLQRRMYDHALLILDFEGCGTKYSNPLELETVLDKQLEISWGAAAKAIVINPEVDIWVWGSDNAIAEVIRWDDNSYGGIRNWLRAEGFEIDSNSKPKRPKEAIEAVLQRISKPRSSAIYKSIMEKISLEKCKDEAFIRLKDQLRKWYPAN